jgi:hypothetical protein
MVHVKLHGLSAQQNSSQRSKSTKKKHDGVKNITAGRAMHFLGVNFTAREAGLNRIRDRTGACSAGNENSPVTDEAAR